MPPMQPVGYQDGLGAGMSNQLMPMNPTMMPGVEGNMDMYEESSPLMPTMPMGQSAGEGTIPGPYYGEPLTHDYPLYGNQAVTQPLAGMGEMPYMPPQMMPGQMPIMSNQPTALPTQSYQQSMLQENDCGCGGYIPAQPYANYGMPTGFPPSPMYYGSMVPGGFSPAPYPFPGQMGYSQPGFAPAPMFGNPYPAQTDFDQVNPFQRNDESSELYR